MKLIENAVEKVITKKLQSLDFKAIIKEIAIKYKDEIISALKTLLKEAIAELVEKVKNENV